VAEPKKKIASVTMQKTVDSSGKETHVQVLKIQAYPIEGALVRAEGKPAEPFHVLKLTEIGFIGKYWGFLKTGQTLTVSFNIPVVDVRVSETVRVIKTYESTAPVSPTSGKRAITVEMHFKSLSENSRPGIREFVRRIGQKS
jgi:hypothetical protein